MTAELTLTEITLRGTPRQMGLQYGEQLQERIRAFIAMRFAATMDFLQGLGHTSPDELTATGRACLARYAQWHPAGYEEHCGIADGAGVDPGDLYTAANMTDVRDVLAFGMDAATPRLPADAEGCTAVLLPGGWTADGTALAAQTWDLNPQDLDFVIAVHRLPTDGPETWSVTCTGCLSLVGMNAFGLAVGTTNIKTRGSRVGVGYMSVLHKMLSCSSWAEAAEVCRSAPRAAAHTYWLAGPEQMAEWETTAWSCVERNTLGAHWLARSNHCLIESHASREAEPPSASSRARLARVEAELDRHHAHDVASLMALFANRSDGVDSINRWPEDGQGTATNSVVICAPARRELWACRGPADRGVWRHLTFAGVA